jgi:lipid-A-disaccharide synthase
VVPELIQSECAPERVARALEEYLDGSPRAERVRRDLGEVRRRLGEPGAFDRAAEAVLAEAVGSPEVAR